MGRPGDQTDDDELMRAFQDGDVDAFEALILRYRRPLTAFASAITHDPGTVEDVVQETFVRVYEQHRDYLPSGRFRAWIYTIARNLCYDRFREPKIVSLDPQMPLILLWPRGQESEPDAQDEQEHAERLAKVERAARGLPEAMREAVLLRYYEGMRLKDIADVQDCPVGTVKSRLHYALKRIEEQVTDPGA